MQLLLSYIKYMIYFKPFISYDSKIKMETDFSKAIVHNLDKVKI